MPVLWLIVLQISERGLIGISVCGVGGGCVCVCNRSRGYVSVCF